MRDSRVAPRGYNKLVVSMIALGAVLSSSHAQYPDMPAPGPTDQFPAGFELFNPPVSSIQVAPSAPEIYEYTRDNNAGDTMIMTGGRFSLYPDSTYSDTTEVAHIKLNNFYAATFRLSSAWAPNTRIEIVCSAYQTPADNARMFFASSGSASASIYYQNGRWMAADGAGSSIDLGAYNNGVHTFVYDSAAQTVGIDGSSYSLRGSVSGSGGLYFACNTPGYQIYPMNVVSCKVWQNGTLVDDLTPTINGNFINQAAARTVDVYKSLNLNQGQPVPFTVEATRTASYTGESMQSPSFIAYGSGVTGLCDIVRLDENEVAITLPKVLPSDSMYLVWPRNEDGLGEPVAVNQTEVWWIGPDQVDSGEKFSVFGRNLGDNCHIYIEELEQWVSPDSSNPYKADFTMPSAPNGTYTIWAHNGSGRKYGWAKPFSLVKADAFKWDGPTVEVAGPGVSDFMSALNSSSSGGRIHLPAGTYQWETFVQSFSGRAIIGDGVDSTILTVHPSNTGNQFNARLFDGIYDNVSFSNLTIRVHGDIRILTARFKGKNLRFDTVKFSSLDWPAEGYWPNNFLFENAGPYLFFKNCDFILGSNPGSISIGNARQVFFDDCNFVGAKHNSQLLVAWGTEETSVENCRAYPYNSGVDGHFDGRWFVTAAYWGAVNRIYFGGNQSTDCAPPMVDGYHYNTGEQILIEGGDYRARGDVLAATANTVRISDISNVNSIKYLVTVVKGKGYGQSRKIASLDRGSNTLTVEEPWRVIPDLNSTVVIAPTTYRFAVYDNDLDGKAEWVAPGSGQTASTGVESYGGSVDLVVDNNRMTDLRSGIVHWPLGGHEIDGVRSLQTCFFNTFKDNTLEDCWQGIASMVSTDGGIVDGGILAATFRDNTLDGITTRGMGFSTNTNEPAIRMSVFERNVFNNCADYAVTDSPHVENQIFIDNTGTNNNTGVAMKVSYDHMPVLMNNVWVGYAEDYKEGPATELLPETPLLELPLRVASVTNSHEYAVPVWNQMISDLDWRATTEESWLYLTRSEGTISNQVTDEFTFTVDTNNLPASGTIGTVKVASADGEQQKYVTVMYDAQSDLPPPPTNGPPPAILSSIEITGPSSVDENGSIQLACTGTYSDGSTQSVSPVWSDNSAFASVNVFGLFTAGNVGANVDVTVTATLGSRTDTHVVTIVYIPSTLTGLSVSGLASVGEGTTAQYTCTASYSDGSTQEINADWDVQPTTYASINSSGLLTAGQVGSDQAITVSASLPGFSDSQSVTIVDTPIYTVTFNAGANGSLAGNTSQNVVVGGSASAVTALPATGYHFVKWTGSIESFDNPLIINNVTSDMLVTAQFGDNALRGVTREVWRNVNGGNVSDLTSDSRYPMQPDSSETLGSFEAPSGDGDNFGARIHGYLIPPSTGSYTFWIAGDDQAELWLSSDASVANAVKIAEAAAWTGSREWDKYPGQQSTSITLQAGQRYYISALHKEASMGDNLSVAWSGPSITQNLISGEYLEPYQAPTLASLTISGPATLNEETSANYTCTATYSDGFSIQVDPDWSENSAYATISGSGVLQAGNVSSDQSVTITAAYGDLTDTHSVVIQYIAPTLSSIEISGPTSVDEESSASYTCTASYSDGSSQSVTPTWSENSADTTISVAGLLQAGDVGSDQTVVVTATYGGRADALNVTIRYVRVLTGITISGPAITKAGDSKQYFCTATYDNGSTEQITPVWDLDLVDYATINASGILTMNAVIPDDLDLQVQASYSGLSATYEVATGGRVIYPISGFDGQRVKAELWSELGELLLPLGEMENPDELVIPSLDPGNWYWLTIYEEIDSGPTSIWVRVQGNWISM